jgi:hypothetical protein
METVTGVVRSTSGDPIEGALVMGLDLGYSETDASGRFELRQPEMVLVCWCDGFYPAAKPVAGIRGAILEITMRPVVLRKANN